MHPFALKMYGQIEELLHLKTVPTESTVVNDEEADSVQVDARTE